MNRWWHQEQGQALVEYAFVIMLIALVAVAGLTALGLTVPSVYETVAGYLP